jgi:hypothetical protein
LSIREFLFTSVNSMPSKNMILSALPPKRHQPVVLVDDQDVGDIMHYMPMKHEECAYMYDKIAMYFADADIYTVCMSLWKFCKNNLEYFEEDEEEQRISSPITMLRRGYADCKGYALFIGGVLDALCRRGWQFQWLYRYVPQSAVSIHIGHVFVVVNPKSDNIWVDPVVSTFNYHYINFISRDIVIRSVGARKVAGLQPMMHSKKMGLTNVEQNLLDQLNEYALGMVNAVTITQGKGVFNTISAGVVASASVAVPGVSQALALLGKAQSIVDNTVGPGSLAGKLLADWTSNPLTAPITIVKQLFNPGARTFESDQYEGARFYYYFVLGKTNYTSPNMVADSDVPAGLKWFMDRTGVYISGNEHIRALMTSAQAYIALAAVNSYTTTNLNQVNAAVAVAKEFWNINGAAGSWAQTVGVYDASLLALANQLGESVEQVNAQIQSGQLKAPISIQGVLSSPLFWILGLGAVGLLLTSEKK